MKYDVLTYGRPELRRPAVPVANVSEAVRRLAQDMLATMYAENGLGLAAPQIGRTEALCVVDARPAVKEVEERRNLPPMPLVLINPRITDARGVQRAEEGCLSFPQIYVTIARANDITVTYQDLDGNVQRLRASGLLARIIQHEVDHLHGKLIVDRMSVAQKAALAGRLRRLRQQAREAASAV